MVGHSKWSKLNRSSESPDGERGVNFRMTVKAARSDCGRLSGRPRLRLAIAGGRAVTVTVAADNKNRLIDSSRFIFGTSADGNGARNLAAQPDLPAAFPVPLSA